MATKEMTLTELQKQIDELQAKANVIIQAEKAGVIEELKAKISLYKLTFEELGFKAPEPLIVYKKAKNTASEQGKSNAPSIPKYKNKENEAETWHGGKGNQPLWIKTLFDKLKEQHKAEKKPEPEKADLEKWLEENGYKIPVSVVVPEVATEVEEVQE